MSHKILTIFPLADSLIAQLEKLGKVVEAHPITEKMDVVKEHSADATILITFGGLKMKPGFLDPFEKLQLVANFGVGYDGVDLGGAKKHNAYVTNTPDVLTEEVADLSLGLLLSTIREIPQSARYLREGKWVNEGDYPLSRATLRGRRVGIYGLGRIGLAIAKRLEAFGVTIAYHNRNKRNDVPYDYHSSLVSLAEDVDTLLVAAPGSPDNAKSIGADVFAALGSNGIFVNVGRGTLVDDDALCHALENDIILGAGLDVFTKEPQVPQTYIDHPRTVTIPHIGSASEHTRLAMGQLVVDNVRAWVEEGTLVTPVPETPLK